MGRCATEGSVTADSVLGVGWRLHSPLLPCMNDVCVIQVVKALGSRVLVHESECVSRIDLTEGVTALVRSLLEAKALLSQRGPAPMLFTRS